MIQNTERFKNRKKAFDWLQQQGYRLSERTFYNVCETGCPAVAPDKTLSCFEVGEYLRKHEAKIRKQTGSLSSLREEAETRKAIAALTRDYIAQRISQALPVLIHAVVGKIEHVAEAQAVINQAIADGHNDVSGLTIEPAPRPTKGGQAFEVING